LNEALSDPHARALVAVRGGYGATRICSRADFSALGRYPKWCIGFSDFTAIHLEALRAGVATLHAANLTSLGRGDAQARQSWLDALATPLSRRAFSDLEVLRPGRATGTLVGGNLTLLFTAAASGQLELPPGAILFFEEVNEAPYRIDRMLTALCCSGKLRAIAGVCVGDLAADGAHAVRRAALEAVRDCLGGLGVPILAGLPVGHGVRNHPLPLGVPALLDGSQAALVVNPTAPDLAR
jgi:muramoyltetrapeptide carboxypeptidase